MPVLIGELGRIKVNCLVWTGRVTRAEALGVPSRIDTSRLEFGSRWISYFDSAADISDLDAATLQQMREVFRPMVAALAAKGEFRSVLVSNSRYNDPLLEVWRTMSATDAGYASNPELSRDVHAAAESLGLSPADAADVQAWIEAEVARASAAPP